MLKWIIKLFVVSLAFYTAQACKCARKSSFKQAFCEAKWVTHVNILSNDTSEDSYWLKYGVKHVEIFKTNSNDPLPSIVLTPVDSSVCGVTDLKTDGDYLLAGTVANNELHIYSCLYIPTKDNESNDELGAVEWKKVPEVLQQKLSFADNSTCS